jgi:putative transposase
MARKARVKVPKGEVATYHLRGQVSGLIGDYPLQSPEVAAKYREILFRWASLYFCEIVGFAVMGSHPHDVCRFQAYRVLPRVELEALAERFYPKKYRPMDKWDDERWERFNERVFDVSEFMRNVRGEFTTWYNQTHDRRGPFWAGRFRSLILTDEDALRACVLYVESNPVRPELVQRPEDWPYSSARLRYEGKDEALMPITVLMDIDNYELAVKFYRELLLVTGTRPSKNSRGVVPEEVLKAEQAAGFLTPGIFLKRHACLSDGIAFGSPERTQKYVDELRDRQYFTRRKHPIPTGLGNTCTVKSQRRNRRKS